MLASHKWPKNLFKDEDGDTAPKGMSTILHSEVPSCALYPQLPLLLRMC
jgi:hypothetical protein